MRCKNIPKNSRVSQTLTLIDTFGCFIGEPDIDSAVTLASSEESASVGEAPRRRDRQIMVAVVGPTQTPAPGRLRQLCKF